MKMEIDLSRNEFTGDAVIDRGYTIYDEWGEKSLSSRKIVARVESAVSAMKQKRTKAASIYALACLFALDMRIKEKYGNIFRCLLSYFSWRRETRALNMLKGALDIPADVSDVRTAIEIQLAMLRERIDMQESDEDDDETHGGKRNAKTEERSEATQEKQEDQVTEDADEKISDAENAKDEASEEKTEEIAVKAPDENQIVEIEEKVEAVETVTQENEVSTDQEKELTNTQTQNEYKEEINVFEEISETITDKTDKNKAYDAVTNDLPPQELDGEERGADKLSFIDEAIIDNMIKGEADYVRHNPLDDVRNSGVTDAEAIGNDLVNNADKDAHLYDEMVLGDNDLGGQQMENVSNSEGMKEQTTSQDPNATKSQEQVQSDSNMEAVKQDFENFRMPIAVDISNDFENQMRIDITNSLSDEAKIEMVRLQMEAAREKMDMESAQFDFNAPVDNIDVQEPPSIDPPVSPQLRK